jgi:hypothetical protein
MSQERPLLLVSTVLSALPVVAVGDSLPDRIGGAIYWRLIASTPVPAVALPATVGWLTDIERTRRWR